MAVEVSNRYPSRQARSAEAAKAKERRQKIILAVGGVLLLIVLVIEVPKTLKQMSGSTSTPSAPAAVTPAVSAAPSVAGAAATRIPGLKHIDRLPAKDPFAAQVSDSSVSGAPGTVAPADAPTVSGPAVKKDHFTAKDPFATQIAAPPSTAATSAASTSTAPNGAGSPQTPAATSSSTSGGYIVVLATTPASAGTAPADRAVVAAKNAGLPNVQSKSLESSKAGSPFTVFSGPYQTQAGAQQELVRALRAGYTTAYTRALPNASTTSGGF